MNFIGFSDGVVDFGGLRDRWVCPFYFIGLESRKQPTTRFHFAFATLIITCKTILRWFQGFGGWVLVVLGIGRVVGFRDRWVSFRGLGMGWVDFRSLGG